MTTHELETVALLPPPLFECDGPTRLRRVADIIETFPEMYDQGVFAEVDPECGTTACIAGWAMLDAGYVYSKQAEAFFTPDGCNVDELRTRFACGEVVEGARLLGLDMSDANFLFMGKRPLEGTVAEALRDIADGTPVQHVWDYYGDRTTGEQ